jgi:D-3-phosphoglycerate dehydrogenase
VLAESLGMKVVYYDVIPKMSLGNATQCNSMEEVLSYKSRSIRIGGAVSVI